MAKMTPKAWFYINSDFWGDLSRFFFCIRRTIRARLGALWLGLLKHCRKTFDINENVAIWVFLAALKNVQKGIFFVMYGGTSPHPTAKPSWGWLRVVARKLRLVLFELDRTRNKVTAKAEAYLLAGVLLRRSLTAGFSAIQLTRRRVTAPAEENFRRLNETFYEGSCGFGFVSLI